MAIHLDNPYVIVTLETLITSITHPCLDLPTKHAIDIRYTNCKRLYNLDNFTSRLLASIKLGE